MSDVEYDNDLDLDGEAETEVQTETEAPTEEIAKVRKVNREAAALRERAKEAEALVTSLLEKRMAPFAEVEPEGLSAKQRIAWLEKMEAKFPPAQASEASEPEEAAAEPPTEAEKQLATASGGPATGTSQAAQEKLTVAEMIALGKKDPAQAMARMNADLQQ